MTEWIILDEAHAALRTVVGGVQIDGWELPTPCSDWNVTQVLQHAVGDQLGFASFITGGPRPTEDPFAPSGTLSGSPRELAEAAMKAASEAWATVAEDAQDVPVPLPPFKVPAPVGAGACALDAAVHAWDIAMATGQPSPLTPALSRELLVVAKQIVEGPRAYGYYAAEVDGQEGDDDVAVLLRYLGRRPGWVTS